MFENNVLQPTESLKKLHGSLIERTPNFNVSYDQFQQDMMNEDNLKRLYSNLSKDSNFKVDYDTFKNDMFSQPEQSTSTPTIPQPKLDKETIARQKYNDVYQEPEIQQPEEPEQNNRKFYQGSEYGLKSEWGNENRTKKIIQSNPFLRSIYTGAKKFVGGAGIFLDMVAGNLTNSLGGVYQTDESGNLVAPWDKGYKTPEKSEFYKGIRKWESDSPKLTGGREEFIGGLLPQAAATIGVVALKNPQLANVYMAGMTASSAGSGAEAYDDYIAESGEKYDEARRIQTAIGYGAMEYLGEKIGLDYFMPKGYGKLLTGSLRGRTNDIADIGKDVIENYARLTKKSAWDITKGLLAGAGVEGGEEGFTEIGQIAVDAWVTGKDVTGKEIKDRMVESMIGGALMGQAITPFSMISQSQANKQRRRAQGSVTLSIDENGTPVELVEDETGKQFAITPNGEEVSLTEQTISKAATFATPDFEQAIKELSGKTKTISKNLEAKMQERNVDNFLSAITNPKDKLIHVVTKDTPEGEQFYVIDETPDGMLTLIDGQLNKFTASKREYVDKGLVKPQDFKGQRMAEFNTLKDKEEYLLRQEEEQKKKYSKVPEIFEANGNRYRFNYDPKMLDGEGGIYAERVDENGEYLGIMEPIDAKTVQSIIDEQSKIEEERLKAEREEAQRLADEKQRLIDEQAEKTVTDVKGVERPIVTESINGHSVDMIEGDGFFEIVPNEKLTLDKALPILEKKFKDSKTYKLEVDKAQVEIPAQSRFDEPTYKTEIRGIKIVPISSKTSANTPTNEGASQVIDSKTSDIDEIPDYENMPPEQFLVEYGRDFGEEEAIRELQNVSFNIDKKIQKLTDKHSASEKLNERAKIKKEINTLTEKRAAIKQALGKPKFNTFNPLTGQSEQDKSTTPVQQPKSTITPPSIQDEREEGTPESEERKEPGIETEVEGYDPYNTNFHELPEPERPPFESQNYGAWVLDYSDDPAEIADAYEREKLLPPRQSLLPWQEVLLTQKFPASSFARFGDKNWINRGLAQAWLKSGKDEFGVQNLNTIDQFVHEMESEGHNIDVNDVIEFIMQYPTKNVRSTTDIQNKLKSKYRAITGQSIEKHGKGVRSETNTIDEITSFLESIGLDENSYFSFEQLMDIIVENKDKLQEQDYNKYLNYIQDEITRADQQAADLFGQEREESGEVEQNESKESTADIEQTPGTEEEPGEINPIQQTIPEIQNQKLSKSENDISDKEDSSQEGETEKFTKKETNPNQPQIDKLISEIQSIETKIQKKQKEIDNRNSVFGDITSIGEAFGAQPFDMQNALKVIEGYKAEIVRKQKEIESLTKAGETALKESAAQQQIEVPEEKESEDEKRLSDEELLSIRDKALKEIKLPRIIESFFKILKRSEISNHTYSITGKGFIPYNANKINEFFVLVNSVANGGSYARNIKTDEEILKETYKFDISAVEKADKNRIWFKNGVFLSRTTGDFNSNANHFYQGTQLSLRDYILNKQEEKKEGDFDYSVLFNEKAEEEEQQPEQSEEDRLEQEYQKSSFSKEWAATRKEAIAKLYKSIKEAETTIKDWSSRQYKKSGKSVEVGQKYDEYGQSVSVDAVNERRRQNVIRNAQEQKESAIKDLKQLGIEYKEENPLKNKEVEQYYVDNEDGSQSVVKVMPNASLEKGTFYVESWVVKTDTDETQRLQIKKKNIPWDRYDEFIADIKKRGGKTADEIKKEQVPSPSFDENKDIFENIELAKNKRTEKETEKEIPSSPDGKYQIYKYEVKNKEGGTDVFYGVPSVENNGIKGMGDDLFKTIPEALKQVEYNRTEGEKLLLEKQKEKEEYLRNKQKEEEERQAKKEANSGKSKLELMNEAKQDKILNTKLNYNGVIKTRKQNVEDVISEGGRVETAEVDKIKDLSRSAYSRMNGNQQRDFEERQKEAGKKTEYRLYEKNGSFTEITKAEYDYAISLSKAEGEVKPIDKNVDANLLAKIISTAFTDAYGTFKANQERLIKAQNDFLKLKNLTLDQFNALSEEEKDKLIVEAKEFLNKQETIPQEGDKIKFTLGGREYTLPFDEYKLQPNGDVIFDLFGQKRLPRDQYEIVGEDKPEVNSGNIFDQIEEVAKNKNNNLYKNITEQLSSTHASRRANIFDLINKSNNIEELKSLLTIKVIANDIEYPKEINGRINYLLRHEEIQDKDNTPEGQATKKGEKIEDFGEKIEGAKKDQIRKYFNKINLNGKTLSAIFPKPDIKALLETGLSVKDVAGIKVAYEFATRGKKRDITSIKFYASYAKNILAESINIEFKSDGRVFTDYGKSQIILRTKAYQAISEKLGNEYLSLDLTKVKISEADKSGSSTYSQNGEPVTGINYLVQYYVSGTKYFVDIEDAVSEFVELVKNNTKTDTVEYKRKLNIYRSRSDRNDIYIGYQPKGKPFIKLRDGFKNSSEAFEAIQNPESHAELQLMLERILAENKVEKTARKPRLKYTNETTRDRVGKDWREGKDIGAKELAETFGFRGIEFGNWVNQKERQVFVNSTYDSFMDLAQLLNISPKAISLGGNLALSFGSRGSGNASAHYEPERRIINLTKTKGLGSLAHEWWHAIDNSFNKFESTLRGMRAASNLDFQEGIRDEMKQVFTELYNAVNKSSKLKNRSSNLDSSRSKDYFSLPHEMSARSFENYILKRLNESGQINDFIVNYVSNDDWNGDANTYPYPLADEAENIYNAFQKIFDTIQEKKEGDNIILYEPKTPYSTNKNANFDENQVDENKGSYKTKEGETIQYSLAFGNDITTDSDLQKEEARQKNPSLRRLKEGEQSAVEMKYTADKNFTFSGNNKIESTDDVAYLFRQLENKSVENMFATLVDENGKATVIHISMGGRAGTVVDFGILSDAISRFKPAKVYLIHNHPSGNLKYSSNDLEIHLRAIEAFGDVIADHIIINTTSGQYARFRNNQYDYSIKDRPTSTSEPKNYKVIKLDKQIFRQNTKLGKIGSSDDVAQFLTAQRFTNGKKMSVLILGRNHEINAYLHLPSIDIANRDQVESLTKELQAYSGRFGGDAVIISGNIDSLSREGQMLLRGMRDRLKASNVSLLDVMSITNGLSEYESWANEGLLEPEQEYGNNGLPTVNSNGKPIYYTEEGVRNFWRWFGDSKVVDEQGRPLVVYHGTNADFSEFNKENFSAGAFGKGFYFTPSKETSEIFANKKEGDKVMEVYLSLQNPFIIEDGDNLIDHFKKYTTDDLVKNKGIARDFSLHLKEKGYDGVIFKDDDIKYKDQWEYVVFEPNQIKSATGNKGTFDGNNPDIRASIQSILKRGEENVLKAAEELKNLNDERYNTVKRVADRLSEELNEKVNVVRSVSQLPKHVKDSLRAENTDDMFYGVYDPVDDTVYLISNNIESEKRAERIVFHEVVGHKGLRGLLGKNYYKVMTDIWDSMEDEERAYIKERYPNDDEIHLAEEFMAEMAENYQKHPQWFDKIITNVMEWLRKIFPNITLSHAEMRNLIRESKEYMQEPKPEQFDDVLEYARAYSEYRNKARAAKKNIPKYSNDPDYQKMLERGDKKPSKTELKEILNQVRQAIQDRDLPVRDFINKIVERGGVLKNANNAYRDISLSYGRADKLYKDFREGKMDPVLKIIAEKFIKGGKATNFEVMVYMISKHAPERNRKIKSDKLVEWQRTNPEATIDEIREFEQSIAGNDYSGVLSLNSTIDKNGKKTLIKPEYENDPDGFAQFNVEQFEGKFDKQDIKDFWEAVNNASDFVLQRWIAANQITQTEYDRMKKDYQHYIPLKGWWDDASKEFDYHTNQGGGKSLKKAEGRTTLSDHPLAYLEEQGFHSITEQVENEYRSTMLRFVLDNMKGNEDLIRLNRVYFVQNINTGEWDYQLERPSQDMFDAGIAKMVKYSDHFKMRKPSQGKEHEVWVDTKYGTYAMVFPQNPDVAMALNSTNNLVFGMDVSAVNRVFGASIAKWTNIQKALFTSWNVIFPPKNLMRDYGESVSYFLAYDPKIAGAFAKSHPIAFKTAFTYIFNNSKYSPSNNEEHAMFEDFMNMGGQTGWTHQKTPEQYNKQQIKQIKKGLTGKKINIGSAIASYSQLFEDATRFAVYRAAVMNGKSKQDAAFLAKEAVTNFNRKGKITKTLDSLYAFFNPAIQGAVKNFALAKNKPKQFTYLVSAWTLAGFLVAEACRAFDGDDDEYEKLNPFVRMNYLIIPIGKSYIRFPLPQFFRAFYGLGSNISDMVHGKTEIGEATGRGVLNFINAMSPVDITAFFEKEGKWYAPFIPTIAKPVADLAANRDYMGYEIFTEPFTKDLKDKLANSGLHKKNVNTALKFLTDAAFELGGGEASDEKRKKRYIDNKGQVKKVAGALDINPSVVEYLIKTYTGGTGAVVTDFVDLITLTAGGEFSIDKLPFFNTFVRNFPERRLNALGEYYELKNENDNYFDIAKSKKGTDYEYYKTLMESKKHNEVRVVFDRAEKEIDILKKQHDMNSITLDEYLDKRGEIMENAIKQINE